MEFGPEAPIRSRAIAVGRKSLVRVRSGILLWSLPRVTRILGRMGLFGSKDKPSRKDQKAAKKESVDRLTAFAASREGVEAYFEESTPREPAAILLVAYNGEWTRRRVPDIGEAIKLAKDLGLPLYEVARTGYPRAMREWSAANPRWSGN